MTAEALSPAEILVLRLIAEGLSDAEVAVELCKSVNTVRTHRDHLLGKTGCRNRIELARFAVARGYVPASWFPPRRNRADA